MFCMVVGTLVATEDVIVPGPMMDTDRMLSKSIAVPMAPPGCKYTHVFDTYNVAVFILRSMPATFFVELHIRHSPLALHGLSAAMIPLVIKELHCEGLYVLGSHK